MGLTGRHCGEMVTEVRDPETTSAATRDDISAVICGDASARRAGEDLRLLD